MKSEMCKTCIHTKVCRHDKNLVGDMFVMGNPLVFDNRKLYEEYEKWEAAGFPCDDYLPSAQPEIIRCKDCKHTYLSDNFGITAPWLICKGHIGNVYKVNDDDFCSWGERKTDG